MATVSATQFISRSSNVNARGATGLDAKVKSVENGLRNKRMTHSGLRSFNKLDMLQLRTNAKAASRQLRRKGSKTENAGGWQGVIKCGSGMNLVFVGAEVGPWSKTGGLGDVLGGTIYM